jgi:phosphoglucosamine mutase
VLRFGTDGVRGDADADLTPPLVFALGRAAARVLAVDAFVVGRDTRTSGPRIEDDLTRGFAAEGARATSLGVAPTPAVAFVAQREAKPGAIVSASHNSWTDNGVKIVGADGRKLPDAVETAIEAEMLDLISSSPSPSSEPASQSRARADALTPVAAGELDAYVAHLVGALEGRSLGGLHVVLDCANGAASELGPRALAAAGARVEVINAQPDGRNINAVCGSTYPQGLQHAVRVAGADLGLALDGDADRVVAVDEHGELVDGDQIMVMTALDWHERGALRDDAIVVTVMSNLGLRRALGGAGVGIVETPVGDRHVVAAMAERNLAIGGEQSGHIVFADLATTGDGMLTGLIVADLVARRGGPLSQLAAQMTRLPQVLVSVRPADSVELTDEPVRAAITAVERSLGDRGRVVVRASGTEKVVRVMVEAPTEAEAADAAARVQAALEA